MSMPIPMSKKYTADEFYKMDLPERCELINGEIVDLASPNQKHQEISGRVYNIILNYIDKNKGKCKVFPAPADVKLSEKFIVQPDIYVACDPDKLDGQYHIGGPDWVIEITSPSTALRDCIEKLSLYKSAGTKEYWIIDTENKRVVVHIFTEQTTVNTDLYTFSDSIPVFIYKDRPEPLSIRLADYFE